MAKKNTYKLPEEKRRAIIADRKGGMFAEDVAAKHGVGRTTVFRVMLDQRKADGTYQPRGARGPRNSSRADAERIAELTRRTSGKPVAAHPILSTEGRWAALADYAAANGVTATRAQQLWHKARAGAL